jgi:hypothetical protein
MAFTDLPQIFHYKEQLLLQNTAVFKKYNKEKVAYFFGYNFIHELPFNLATISYMNSHLIF